MLKTIRKRILNLHPIEIFIMLVIVSLTVFVVKFFGIKEDWKIIRVEVIKKAWSEDGSDPYGYRAPFWLSDKIKIGQEEKNPNSGKVIATLIDMESYERSGEESDLYLTLKVQVTLNKRNGKYSYKDLPLDLGSEIKLDLNNMIIPGQIVDNDVPENGYPTKYFIATVRGRNIDPWIYSKVIPNLTMKNRASNENIVQILSVKTEEPSFQPINIDSSNLFFSTNQNKDLVFTAKIKAYQKDNRWYFGGHQNLKVGNIIYLHMENIDLNKFIVENLTESSK